MEEDLCMQSFKKAFFATISFIIILSLFSAMIILPWSNSHSVYYLDSDNRKELAGSIDCIISGASHGLTGFIPEIIDNELSWCSYNISGTLMTMEARTFILREELERNPVKTVVIEISYNALTRTQDSDHGEGDFPTLARIGSASGKLRFIKENLTLNECLDVYSRALLTGVLHLWAIATNQVSDTVDKKGYYEKNNNDVTLPETEVASAYNSETISIENNKTSVDELIKQISMCQEKGCRTIIAVTPLSNSIVWSTENFDEFYNWLKRFSEEQNCEFYDFNLLKDKYNLFVDSESYFDNMHLSKQGATAFSKVFAEVVKKAENEDVSDLFYKNYKEVKMKSPYAQYK